jgi:polar amino acid transport system ATP-binding protein/sulfate transport system ATP-binding protein
VNDYDYTLKETLLAINHVSVEYGDAVILRDVNAVVRNIVRPGLSQGQVVGFLGPSGIGKTQLLRVLAGLQVPTRGEVLVGTDQKPVTRGLVGVVAQNYPLFEHRTVLGNLVLAGKQAGMKTTEAQERAMGYLKRFELERHARLYPLQLSGGQRQRVAIVQQLLCSDDFLLMDEPFSGLDPIMIDNVSHLIAEVAAMDELRTIVVVTHDIAAAITVSDTLWLMGRDRDIQGQPIPGARIQEQFDLIERELAWHPDVTGTQAFADCVREVRAKFQVL